MEIIFYNLLNCHIIPFKINLPFYDNNKEFKIITTKQILELNEFECLVDKKTYELFQETGKTFFWSGGKDNKIEMILSQKILILLIKEKYLAKIIYYGILENNNQLIQLSAKLFDKEGDGKFSENIYNAFINFLLGINENYLIESLNNNSAGFLKTIFIKLKEGYKIEIQNEKLALKYIEQSKKLKSLNFNNVNKFRKIGLSNIGATCYMNATLECFINVDPLTRYLLTESNYNTIINDKKTTGENNYNNLVIKEYSTKEEKKDKEIVKNKYNSTNNSFSNKIYQKKISSQKEYLTSNNSLQNIKLQSIKKNEININKIIYNNSNKENKFDNNIIIKSEGVKSKLVKKDLIPNNNKKKKEEEEKKEIIIKAEDNINKNDNNKKLVEKNSSYKTNEFENRNISEFPVNGNIINDKLQEHNNLYINNNNITILNTKNKEENEKEEEKNEEKKDINATETKELFKSIQSSDTLINKDNNMAYLNSNIVKKEEIKEINNDNKKIDINIDIKKDNKEIKNEIKEKDSINIIDNNNIISKELSKEENKSENKKENIDLNFIEENILGKEKEELDNNKIKEKELFIEDKTIKEEIVKEDKEKKIEEEKKEKENDKKINEIKEGIILESNLENKTNKNKREFNKQNEKLMTLYKQDMLCIPSQAKNVKSSLRSNLFSSTLTKDCTFYQEKQKIISNQIKDYYKQNKKYPDSNINYYLYGRQIGHGAFGQVNLALHIASGRLVAIKIFAKKNLKNTRAKEKIMTEIETLSNFHHPFINQILDNFETDTHIFIVMEYVCGDLLGFIRKRAKLSESVSKIIFKQLIEGLKYIHKKHFVHRDIKLDNILIDLTNTIKICDFGVSKHFEDKNEIMFDHCGTPAYIAPEIFEHAGYKGPPCDIWSAGVTLYYMLAGEQPFKAGSISELEKIIKAGEFKEIEGVSKEANNLLSKILQVNPRARISLDEILNHKWLDKVDLNQRHKLNLFTEAEKILMSKFDVNYLSSDKSELIENFTLKNIEDNPKDNKNKGNTKSIIFAPYNTFIDEFDTDDKKPKKEKVFEEEKDYKELKIENDICRYGIKAQQLNIQYELSNNGDFDNGLIKTEKQEDFLKENEKIEKMFEAKKGKKWKNKDKFDDECDIINVRKDILEKIEREVGYKSDYIIKCIKKNKINYATATYFLLEKDEQFN